MKRLLMLILLSSHGFAQAEFKISINKSESIESYSEIVGVAGEFLKGIQMESASEEKLLHVHFPENSEGDLCIELSSIDGKYKADIKAEISSSESGMQRIPFDFKYQDRLRNYSNNEIAILARIEGKSEDQCSGNAHSTTWLVSSWSSDVSKNLILLIRSDARKDVAYFPDKDNPRKKCKKIRKPYNVSYDKYCVLENVDFDNFEKTEIVIDSKHLQDSGSIRIKIN